MCVYTFEVSSSVPVARKQGICVSENSIFLPVPTTRTWYALWGRSQFVKVTFLFAPRPFFTSQLFRGHFSYSTPSSFFDGFRVSNTSPPYGEKVQVPFSPMWLGHNQNPGYIGGWAMTKIPPSCLALSWRCRWLGYHPCFCLATKFLS